jgi:hypothetical protein
MDDSPLERRRRRVTQIRKRIAAAAAALFIAVFAGITVQLASGHDPALKSKGATSSHQASSLSPVTTSQS